MKGNKMFRKLLIVLLAIALMAPVLSGATVVNKYMTLLPFPSIATQQRDTGTLLAEQVTTPAKVSTGAGLFNLWDASIKNPTTAYFRLTASFSGGATAVLTVDSMLLVIRGTDDAVTFTTVDTTFALKTGVTAGAASYAYTFGDTTGTVARTWKWKYMQAYLRVADTLGNGAQTLTNYVYPVLSLWTKQGALVRTYTPVGEAIVIKKKLAS
jgi:hypothetical protein